MCNVHDKNKSMKLLEGWREEGRVQEEGRLERSFTKMYYPIKSSQVTLACRLTLLTLARFVRGSTEEYSGRLTL